MSGKQFKERSSKLSKGKRKDYANKEDIEEIKEENDEDESLRSSVISKIRKKN